ncbi:MAG: 16S rRNA (guanine(966)-N(2))-methyltransferase RsmD [Zetaproteobacteria bacterium]|nr:MAG: 16S rRNA (guanine(966)-N(2))-methyltransferase RsmD [Zetaproteobacteria bacterium]
MRVTAGTLRGRVLRVPRVAGLRPTPARAREAMFNILGDMRERSMLDLFAGSGIMALEAISRGALRVVSVEATQGAVRRMRAIQREWGVRDDRWHVLRGRVEQVLGGQLGGMHFDLVFADPPYAQGFAARLPTLLDQAMLSCEWLVIEESSRIQPAWPAAWHCDSTRRYGDTSLHFLKRCGDSQ